MTVYELMVELSGFDPDHKIMVFDGMVDLDCVQVFKRDPDKYSSEEITVISLV